MSTTSLSRGALALIVGATGTAASGALVVAVIRPSTDVPDDRWSYPWTAGALVPVSIVFALLNLLLLVGFVALGRSGAAAGHRAGRAGIALAVAAEATYIGAELASIPIRDQLMDDTVPLLVGATFGLATAMLSAGLLLHGWAVLRAGRWSGWHRWTPMVAGGWSLVTVALAFTPLLGAAVAVQGLVLLALGVAFRAEVVATGGALAVSPG